MKIPHYYEVWRVISEYPYGGKFNTCAAKLEVQGGRGTLIATNGRVLVVLHVAVDEKDETGLIPADLLGLQETKDDEEPARHRELTVSGGRVSVACEGGTPPDWRAALPAADAPGTLEVRINPKLLYDLARAMACQEHEALTLKIPAARDGQVRDPIRVEIEGADAVGTIMPAIFIPKETP